MKGLAVSPTLTLPIDAVTQTFVIFGKRGAGKTNTAVVLAEEMLRVGAPIVVLDPIDAWWGLKTSFDGASAGLPIYVFGGNHADQPLAPTSGELVAQTVIEHRVPMILSMRGWSGMERAKFVTAFAKYLLQHNNRVPVHVFIEEADAFIPQRPYKGEEEMLGAMDRLVRWGRQDGIGATVITQRSAKANKDVTTQAETLIAHRTTGPQDRDAIDAWIKFHADDVQRQQVLSTLPVLADGTAWVWSPQWLGILEQVKFRRRETYDSASTPKFGEKKAQPKAFAAVDLAALGEKITATAEQMKANDPATLKAQIADLRRQLAQRPVETRVEKVVERVEVPVIEQPAIEAIHSLRDVLERALIALKRLDAAGSDRLIHPPRPKGLPPPATPPKPVSPTRLPEPEVAAGDLLLGKTARALLNVLAQFPTRSQQQLAILSGYSPTSGGFTGAITLLRKRGMIVGDRSDLSITEFGRETAGPVEPLPEDLLTYWVNKLSKTDGTLLRELVERGARSQAELAEATGYSPTSGGYTGAITKLRKLELIKGDRRSLAAVEGLFS